MIDLNMLLLCFREKMSAAFPLIDTGRKMMAMGGAVAGGGKAE